jgi:hypothetical protein
MFFQLMTEMHGYTQKLALAQEDMRIQLEALHRTMRAHFSQPSPSNPTMQENGGEPQQQPPIPFNSPPILERKRIGGGGGKES